MMKFSFQNRTHALFIISLAIGAFVVLSGNTGFAEISNVVFLQTDQDGVQRGTIVMESYSFTPSHLVAKAGVPIALQLKNDSFLVPHNFVIDNPEKGLHYDVTVSAGETVGIQLLLTTPGIYTFYCDKQLFFFPSHREEGMEGRLEVR